MAQTMLRVRIPPGHLSDICFVVFANASRWDLKSVQMVYPGITSKLRFTVNKLQMPS